MEVHQQSGGAGDTSLGPKNIFPEWGLMRLLNFFYLSALHRHAVSFSFGFWHQTSFPVALSRSVSTSIN